MLRHQRWGKFNYFKLSFCGNLETEEHQTAGHSRKTISNNDSNNKLPTHL